MQTKWLRPFALFGARSLGSNRCLCCQGKRENQMSANLRPRRLYATRKKCRHFLLKQNVAYILCSSSRFHKNAKKRKRRGRTVRKIQNRLKFLRTLLRKAQNSHFVWLLFYKVRGLFEWPSTARALCLSALLIITGHCQGRAPRGECKAALK